MKKMMLILLAMCIIPFYNVHAQFGKALNKFTKSVTNDILGKPDESKKNEKQQPEPKCACDLPELVFDLGGNLKLMYSEINISIKDDGSILVKDLVTGNFYIAKDGITQGPIKDGDPRLSGFDNGAEADKSKETDRWANNEYISKSGEKYLINFKGKKYGPYGEIREFQVTKSKEKFAAYVIETVLISEAEAKKMEEAIKNARTDQEKMDLSMQYSQQMMQKMQQGGGANGTLPKLITNIEGVDYEAVKSVNGSLNGNIKYDDILLTNYDKITDLKGKTVLTLKQDAIGAKYLFVNTNNTKYAFYKYGTLTFSDNTVMSEMFNLRWVKVNDQVNLVYMYYSPKRNTIMQCKMQF